MATAAAGAGAGGDKHAFLAEYPSVKKVTWARADGTEVPGYATGAESAPGVILIQVRRATGAKVHLYAQPPHMAEAE